MMDFKITVIIPAYNIENYIRATIESLLNQTYKNFNIIIVDDGSTDSTLKICKEYENSKNFHVFSKKNGGLSSARNFGISKVNTEWTLFVDGDDYIHSETIYYFSKYLNSNLDLISTNIKKTEKLYHENKECFYNVDSEIKEISPLEFLEQCYYGKLSTVSSCAKLFKTNILREVKFKEGILYEDLDFLYKYVSKSKKILTSDFISYYYYNRSESIVNKNLSISDYDFFKAIDNNINYIESINNITLREAISVKLFIGSKHIIKKIIYNNEFKIIKELKNKYKNELKIYILSNKPSFYNKIASLMSLYIPKIYRFFLKIKN